MNNDLISRSALMEKLGERARKHEYDECTELTIYEDMHEVKTAPAVDAGPKLISVAERLPEKSGDYLAFTEKGIFMVLSYSEIHRAFNAYDWCENITPIRCTHWMPLPEVKEHD